MSLVTPILTSVLTSRHDSHCDTQSSPTPHAVFTLNMRPSLKDGRLSTQVGMMVKCCRTYEEVYEGDVGKVIKLDRDGLHDLNVQCDWQQKGGTYWVRYIHTELVGEHPKYVHHKPI